VIAFTDPVAFAAWWDANRKMKKHAHDNGPMTRDDAIKYLERVKELRSLHVAPPTVQSVVGGNPFALDEE
jgi:hypothetical protein